MAAATAMPPNWADVEDDKSDDEAKITTLTDGVKTVFYFTQGADKKTIRVTRKSRVHNRVQRINKAVYWRSQNVKPFNLSTNDPNDKEDTVVDEENQLEIPRQNKMSNNMLLISDADDPASSLQEQNALLNKKQEIKRYFKMLQSLDASSYTKGGGPIVSFDDLAAADGVDPGSLVSAAAASTGGALSGALPTGGTSNLTSSNIKRYVPPSHRVGSGAGRPNFRSEGEYTLRVTNLSEEVTEKELEALILKVTDKAPTRIFLAKQPRPTVDGEYRSKGFAFVTFSAQEDAEKCIRALNRHGYDYMVLSVEWAKPSAKSRE